MSEFCHQPVLLAEVVAALQPKAEGRYYDGTIGGGGHAAALLEQSGPDSWLYGSDRDPAAVEAARRHLAKFAGRFEVRLGTFAEAADWVPEGSCDGALLDLGVSSPQLDRAERGFSFQADGPLDMRMNSEQSLTAAQFLAEASGEELARIFWELGGEDEARRVAWAIVATRRRGDIATTRGLADLVARAKRRKSARVHPATKVFLALRMKVNDELGELRRGLPRVWSRLRPGGRLAVITFQSAEDRVVKEFGRAGARDYVLPAGTPRDVPELRQPRPPILRIMTKRAVRPGAGEVRSNPRSRSAQLRVFEKIYGT